jgi:hypothetical protein
MQLLPAHVQLMIFGIKQGELIAHPLAELYGGLEAISCEITGGYLAMRK